MLKCGVSKDGMSTVLFSRMSNYELKIVHGHEIIDVSPCRSTTMSLNISDEMRDPLFLGNSEGKFTHEALEGHMIDGRHLMMEIIFHYQDGVFLMSISQIKEEFLPTTCMEPYGFYWAIDERIS